MRAGSIPALAQCTIALSVLAGAGSAHAFVKECHQGITTDVLDVGPWPLAAAPPKLSRPYLELKYELPMDVAPHVDDLWTLSALIGNQFNDGSSFDAKDIVALAEYAAKPDAQREHCLRHHADDGPQGDVSALAACKAYILEQIGIGLGDGDTPDMNAMEVVKVHLVFRGKADVPVARFAFHLGQATHALQDGFTHTFRSPDYRHVRTVLNWVDWLRGGDSYDAARDGFEHVIALDNCGGSDRGHERRQAATQATAELAAAVASDEGGRAGRLARAGAVFDSWFQIDQICTAANRWCDAPEQKLVSRFACSLSEARAPSAHDAAVEIGWGALLALMAVRRGRPRTRRRWLIPLLSAALVFLGAGGGAAAADADDGQGRNAPPAKKDEEAKDLEDRKDDLIQKAAPDEVKTLESYPFGVLAGGGFAIDKAGVNVGVGVRYDINKLFTVGGGVDFNPWISIETRRATKGTTNIFGVGVFRLDVRDYLELRLTLAMGASILMFDTWAARQGSIGPYFAISPLGIAIRMSGHLRLLVDPAELVICIPQTTGIPLVYRQHRFAVALQYNF